MEAVSDVRAAHFSSARKQSKQCRSGVPWTLDVTHVSPFGLKQNQTERS